MEHLSRGTLHLGWFIDHPDQILKLTFNVQLNECLFAHAQRILGSAAVQPGSVPRHGAEVDLRIRAEDAVETLLPPEYGGRRIAVGNAAKCRGVLLLLQVLDLRGLNSHGRGI